MSIDDQPLSGDTSTLTLGVHVKVDGLASRPELNGRVGTIVTSVQDSGRYGVAIGGEVVALKPERLKRMAAPVSGTSGWRAEDSFFFSEVARVVPEVDGTFKSALSEAPTGLTLTGATAKARSIATYLAETNPDGQPEDAEAVVRFSVCGCTEMDVHVTGGGLSSASVVELQSLNPQGSDVVVALSILDGKLTKQVWSDGRAVGKPSSMPWYQLKQPTPEATKTIRGVEVVSRYGPGSAASWRGVYVMCTLQRRGTVIRMSGASAATASATTDATALAPVRQQQWERKMSAAAERGDVAMVRDAIAHGAWPDAPGSQGLTPLHLACFKDRSHPVVAKFLVGETTCDMRLRDEEGYTPLDLVVEEGDAALARVLLETPRPAGAPPFDVDAPMEDGTTPLSRAIENGAADCPMVAVLRRAGAKAIAPLVFAGPLYDARLAGEHRWTATPCRFGSTTHRPSDYPPGFLGMLHRVSDQHYSMLALVLDGRAPQYQDEAAPREVKWLRHWLPPRHWWQYTGDTTIVDTVHMDLQDPRNGANLLQRHLLMSACRNGVRALFLHCTSCLTSADLVECLRRCGASLTCVAFSECAVDGSVLRALTEHCPNLRALRMHFCSGEASADDLKALLRALAPSLLWLDMTAPWAPRHGISGHGPRVDDGRQNAPWEELERCATLRVALLPEGVSVAALSGLASCQQLELLHVEADGRSPQPLSVLEPLARTGGFARLDIAGFALDEAASDAVCALANRLTIRGGQPFPRARLAACTRLSELSIRRSVVEDDLLALLPLKGTLRSVHLSPDEPLDPEALSVFSCLTGLRALNLSGCLRNAYEYGEEVVEANGDHLGQFRLSQLRQLDLSSHYDAFYACIDPETIVQLFCCSEHLRIFNLSDNGRKYPWERLRREMRRLAKDSEDARIVVHTGDGVTEVLEGRDGEGDESDDEEDQECSGSDDSW